MNPIENALRDLRRAIQIIDTGYDRLTTADLVGGQPPDISLVEWRELHARLVRARDILDK